MKVDGNIVTSRSPDGGHRYATRAWVAEEVRLSAGGHKASETAIRCNLWLRSLQHEDEDQRHLNPVDGPDDRIAHLRTLAQMGRKLVTAMQNVRSDPRGALAAAADVKQVLAAMRAAGGA